MQKWNDVNYGYMLTTTAETSKHRRNSGERASEARSQAARWPREQIERSGLSRGKVASMAGVSQRTVRKLLEAQTAELKTLEKLASALSVQLPDNLVELAYKRHDWHGLRQANGVISCEYRAFENMHRRVSDPKHPNYPRYGGLGLKIHPDWAMTPDGFERFLSDMGPRPSAKHSIHRTPPTANYGPSTCLWADKKTQSLEQRGKLLIEYNGRLLSGLQFQKIAVKDGFLTVVERNADGSLKGSRRRRSRTRT